MKRIVTIQDISCIGKCSLTVALPIISAMGVETAIIPTAVLSTHTAFKNFTFRDLTDDITKISNHWKDEDMAFDAMYSGYLGSFEQLRIVGEFFARYKTDKNLIIVDPAMGDFGKLYAGFTVEFAKQMAGLCSKADIIVPNLTEASFMLGVPYAGDNYTEAYIKDILYGLCSLGAKKAVLTGISYKDGSMGTAAFDSEKGEYFSYFNEKIDVSYHGTGDIFASTLTGALMNDFSFEESLKMCVDFTLECIKQTLQNKNSRWYGVDFETALPFLIKRISHK